MEIVFEILFEVVLSPIAEILLQIVAEFIFEVIGRGLKQPFSRRAKVGPVAASVAYALCGAAMGGLTLLAFPHTLIRNPHLRLANLIVGPFVAGLAMHLVGRWCVRHDRPRSRFETFAAGFAFAAAFGMVRYFGTRW